MAVNIQGDNSASSPGITGGDTDTGVRMGTNELSLVTGGTNRVNVDSSGRVQVGTATARNNFSNQASGLETAFQIEGTTFGSTTLSLIRNSADNSDAEFFFAKSRGGSNNVDAVTSGTDLGAISWQGADGTTFQQGIKVFAEASADASNDNLAAHLIVSTNSGGTGVSERVRILSSGGVTFNGDTATANALDDYEEGTWTPSAQNFSVSGTSTLTGKYVKIGRQVTVGIKFANTGTIAYGTSCLITLPFALETGTEAQGLIGMLNNLNTEQMDSNKNGNQCKLDGEGGSRFFVGQFDTTSNGDQLLFGGTYIAAS